MNILVTGGAGYVGSVLVQTLLQRGHSVRVLDSLVYGGRPLLACWGAPGFEFVKGDVRERPARAAALAGMEAVVHLAAIVGDPACARQPELACEVNVEGSIALLRDSSDGGVSRFLFASTCSNYGKMAEANGFVDENSPLSPVSLYARTKVCVERAVLEARNGMATTALRFATVFGVSPRMRFDLTVNEFTREMIANRRLVVFGEQFWRPYVHVRELARAVAAILEAPPERVSGQVLNVGSTTENYRKQDLVELIRPYAPDAEVEYVHRDEDPRDYRVSFEKIRDTVGFVPRLAVPDGIREVARLVADRVIEEDASCRN